MADQAALDAIGRWVDADDLVTAAPVRRLAATLGHDGAHWPADMLPPLAHWLYHLPEPRADALGRDGHPASGGLVPAMPHPRRMWAGGRLRFHTPVPIGAVLTRRTTLTAIDDRADMTFVTLRHELAVAGVTAIEEEQDLVYLPIAAPRPTRPVERPPATRRRTMAADAVLLFRFSALTFNAHRIHYDLPYAKMVEGYPALVVHGPLQALLLIDEALRDGVRPAAFAFRARAPLYVDSPFTLAGAGNDLWVEDASGTITMTAQLEAA